MVNESENLFAKYLEKNGYTFERNFIIDSSINNKNVDFRITSPISNKVVCADIKEIRDTAKRVNAKIIAEKQLRLDLPFSAELSWDPFLFPFRSQAGKMTMPVIILSNNRRFL